MDNNNLIGRDVIINKTGEKAYIRDYGVFEDEYVLDNDWECHTYSRNEFTLA
jgi:hypothetical protein